MKKYLRIYYFNFIIGLVLLVLLTIFAPKELNQEESSLHMLVSMPIAVFMASFISKLRGVFACLSVLIIAKIINLNIEDYTSVQRTIYIIQLVVTAIFWFILVNIISELSETIWAYKHSLFKNIIAYSLIIPSTYIFSLWLSEIFLVEIGIIGYVAESLLIISINMVWNIMYCLVGTSTIMIITYPYLSNNLSKNVVNRVLQGEDDYIIEKNKKAVIRKNNRYWKVDDKLF